MPNICLKPIDAPIILQTISNTPAITSAITTMTIGPATYAPMGANLSCIWRAASRCCGSICCTRELVSMACRMECSQPTCVVKQYMKARYATTTRTIGTIQPGRAAISANAFLGSMNTSAMRPTSPNGGAALAEEGSGVIRIGGPEGGL